MDYYVENGHLYGNESLEFPEYYEEDKMHNLYNDKPSKEIDSFKKVLNCYVLVVFPIITVVGVVENGFALFIIAKYMKRQTQGKILVQILSITDMCFLLLCVPTTTVDYTVQQYPFGEIWCKLSKVLLHTSLCITMHALCAISVERFLMIMFPIKFRIPKKRLMYTILLAIVPFDVAANIPAIFVNGLFEYYELGKKHTTCYVLDTKHELAKAYYLTFTINAWFIPVIIIVVGYTTVFVQLLHFNSWKQSGFGSRAKNNIRFAKLILLMEIVFLICWSPIFVMTFLTLFTDVLRGLTIQELMSLNLFANTISYANSCLNPVMYVFLSKVFRQNCKHFMQRTTSLFRRKSTVPSVVGPQR